MLNRVSLTLTSMVLAILAAPSGMGASDDRIQISVGKPGIWSLEQAHYLLNRMRRENRDLQSKTPSVDDLNPNKINGTRLEILTRALSVSGGFSQEVTSNNRIALAQYQRNVSRRDEVQTQLEALRLQQLQTDRDKGALSVELANLKAEGAAQALQDAKQAEIDAAESQHELIAGQITKLETELSALSVAAPTLTPQTADDISAGTPPASIAKSYIDKLVAGTTEGLSTPSLHASTALDNFIQMQYEIIAKQITLLKDEAGPGKRVIFLELPTSIYSRPNKAKGHLAKVAWELEGVYEVTNREACSGSLGESQSGDREDRDPAPNRADGAQSGSTNDVVYVQRPSLTEETIRHGLDEVTAEALEKLLETLPQNVLTQVRKVLSEAQQANATKEKALRDVSRLLQADPNEKSAGARQAMEDAINDALAENTPCETKRMIVETEPHTLEIVPRQAALNVSQIHNTVKGFNLGVLFIGIFLPSAKVSYQRRRELYDQFIAQDVFASGFGKGESRFGWVFGPNPGTTSVAPGVRTTYAIAVVPDDADMIHLRAGTCEFQRKEVPCDPLGMDNQLQSGNRDFFLQIPGTTMFFVEGVNFTPVRAGERIEIEILGRDFSPDIGVLVNGEPLGQVLSIGQPTLVNRNPGGPVTRNGSATNIPVEGEFEFVNSGLIVAAFTMPASYSGTPLVSLVTSTRARPINYLYLRINEKYQSQRLYDHSRRRPMFAEPVSIKDVSAAESGTDLRIRLAGTGFYEDANTVDINGHPAMCALNLNSWICELSYGLNPGDQLKNDDRWHVTVGRRMGQLEDRVEMSLANPLRPSATAHSILRYKPGAGGYLDVQVNGDRMDRVDRTEVVGATRGDPSAAIENISRTTALLRIQFQAAPDVSQPLLVILKEGSKSRGLLQIIPPEPPRIEKIINPITNAANGDVVGGYPVVITGTNLQYVTKVMFGTKNGTLMGATPTSLQVETPEQSAGKHPVRLETTIQYLGKPLTNLFQLGGSASEAAKAQFEFIKKKEEKATGSS